MQSAIGMDDDHFLINADPSEEVLGNDITVSFSATGEKEDQTTFFSIAIESEENAHLSDEYLFNESGIAEILTTDNQKLALHRLDDSDSSSTDYWFSLDGTNKVDFELNFSSFEGESEDPLHTLAIYTSIGETLDVSRNKIIKLKKTESIRLSLTWLNEIVPTEVTDKVDETESGEEPDKMDKANDSTEEPTLPNASEPPAVPASKGNVSSTNLSTPGEVILALDQNTFSFKGNSIDKNPEAKITGPAPTHDKVEKAYGYLAAYDGTTETWVEVEGSEFSDSRARDIKYRFNENTLTLDELLHTRYSFFVGSARIDGVDKTLNPPARSDVFYLADLFKIGFRDWAVDYYPDAHNNGIAIKNISELATAYEIYKNYTLNITATPNSVTYQAGEPVYFAEINDLIKMATIDSGTDLDLSLETLSTYYYDEVAKDPTKPFSDAATFTKLLLEAYDAGGTSQLEKVYYKHIYDLKDPNLLAGYRSFNEGKSKSYPYNQYDNATDHGDRNFQWGKDKSKANSSPFHNIVPSIINPMDAVLQDGVLLTGSGFIDLEKKAQAYLDGDTNTERKYTVDIKATENGTEAAPTVIVFQVQTSWQMFSLEHANGKNGKVGPAKVDITDMATLYDIKHAMIDFAKWVKVNGDGTVVFAVTDVEHAGTFSAISDPYLTNDMDSLITALEGWDIFGNCEHVHYTSDALKNTLEAVNSTDLAGWVDKNGTPILDSAEKVGVIIGGTTENTDRENGYSAVFPAVAGIDTYHTIETVSGQVLDGRPRLSWLDTPANIDTVRNSGGTQYKDVTTREALVETFKDIMNQSTAKKGAAEDTIIEDTIQSEFDYVPGSVKIVRTDESGTEDVTAIADDDPNLVFSFDESGNQVISYQFGTVEYGSKINLRFDLQAKDDYIGSNNVYTNIGVPNLSYVTDLSEPTSQDYTDTPKVNVPIRFPIVDGSEAIVRLGTDVGLKTDERLKASDIVAGIEDYVDNYSQINGDVTYQWELLETDGNGEILYETDENGEIITEQIHETDDKGQIVFEKDTEGNIIYDQVDGKNIPRAIFTEMKLPKISTTLVYDARTGTITDSSGNLPLYNDIFKADALGRYPFRLKVNFAPNDAEEESGVQVGSLTKSGNVTVIVEEVEVMPLPKTGGPGHQIYLMLGLILTIGSGITILNRQKKT